MPGDSLGTFERDSLDRLIAIVNDPDRDVASGYAASLVLGSSVYNPVETSQVAESQLLEQRLSNGFGSLVADLSLSSLLVPTPGRAKRAEGSCDAFRLVAIQGAQHQSASLEFSGYVEPADGAIKVTYRPYHRRVYLDAQYSIGLVKDDRLIAIASAGVVKGSTALKVVQIQDVTSLRRGDEDYFRSGLHAGFLWRDTLVRAWESIAVQLGVTGIAVQGYANNAWPLISGNRDRGYYAAYDAVADRNGYLPYADHDWHKQLTLADNSSEGDVSRPTPRFARVLPTLWLLGRRDSESA